LIARAVVDGFDDFIFDGRPFGLICQVAHRFCIERDDLFIFIDDVDVVFHGVVITPNVHLDFCVYILSNGYVLTFIL